MDERQDVIVIGAGAAGLFAATRAAQRGRRVLLLEKNRKPGVKILMSGGTRCNLTHATDRRGITDAFGRQGRFLHAPLAALGPDELVAMFAAEGVRTKVEETGKVFPVTNRALDVANACLRMLNKSGARLALDEPALGVTPHDGGFLVRTTKRTLAADKVIVTSGGMSYPGCGTTGDGYAWAKALGHRIVPPRPALVPLRTEATWVHELRGVAAPCVRVRVAEAGGGPVAERSGALLFTHFGLSGPVAMDVSRAVTDRPHADWRLACDFAPAETEEAVRQRLEGARGSVATALAPGLPKRLVHALVSGAGVASDQRSAGLSRRQRAQLLEAVKRQTIPITGSLGFKKAEVTAGGVALEEVSSRDMQSRLAPGLYLAGEVLDLDGPIGGYNFQAAFSTGWLAGESV